VGKKLRVGVFGTWRGATLARLFAGHDDVEIVAGCDFNERHLREIFAGGFPKAKLFTSYADLLREEFDILILASYCPDHGPQAVQALQAGKHIFSECTAFHTPAEGVALVEAAEENGLTFMLAENCLYLRDVLEIKRRYRAGEMGEFLYGECEYVHDLRYLMVQNADGSYHWRCWLPPFYYNTHSLGPMLDITGARPVGVIGQAVPSKTEGCPNPIDFAAAFVRLDNGGLIRVLQSHSGRREPKSLWFSLYGAKGSAETDRMRLQNTAGVHIFREGDPEAEYGHSYLPRFPFTHPDATKAGHGGIDFYLVHYYLEAMRGKTPLPIDLYASCDYTLPGIFAYRSWVEGGKLLQIPDFRQRSERDKYRDDHFRCPREEAVRKDQPPPAGLEARFQSIRSSVAGT
jgi:predicted dehydrogenase